MMKFVFFVVFFTLRLTFGSADGKVHLDLIFYTAPCGFQFFGHLSGTHLNRFVIRQCCLAHDRLYLSCKSNRQKFEENQKSLTQGPLYISLFLHAASYSVWD